MKKQHGGRRKGAGRPLSDPSGAKKPISLWLTPTEREHCERLGTGSAAEGLRALLAKSMSRPSGPSR